MENSVNLNLGHEEKSIYYDAAENRVQDSIFQLKQPIISTTSETDSYNELKKKKDKDITNKSCMIYSKIPVSVKNCKYVLSIYKLSQSL